MNLLDRPRDEACRLVALGYLDDAVAARARLGQDQEALHDLRVALRRLRSTLRAYREAIGQPLGKRGRRRLRAIIDATSQARDAEVLIALANEESPRLSPDEQAGCSWWRARLEERMKNGYDHVAHRLEHFQSIEKRLRKRLCHVELDLSRPHRQAHALAELIAGHADEVEDALAILKTIDQVDDAHAARISVKRLRYLVEPYRDDARVAALVPPCKTLQDLLGELHDAQVGLAELARLHDAPETPPAAKPGLSALHARLELRQLRRFAVVEAEWRRGEKLLGPARALVAELRSA